MFCAEKLNKTNEYFPFLALTFAQVKWYSNGINRPGGAEIGRK
jgi:hypothetical protein